MKIHSKAESDYTQSQRRQSWEIIVLILYTDFVFDLNSSLLWIVGKQLSLPAYVEILKPASALSERDTPTQERHTHADRERERKHKEKKRETNRETNRDRWWERR